MSRRWRGRGAQVSGIADATSSAKATALLLAASNARNQQLAADNAELRELLEVTEKRLTGERFQLDWHKGELAAAHADRAAETKRADRAERRADSLAAALENERAHIAGSCSHAADLKAMHAQVGALEQRVHELQQANMGRDVPEIIGWGPALTAGPVRRVLKRGQS